MSFKNITVLGWFFLGVSVAFHHNLTKWDCFSPSTLTKHPFTTQKHPKSLPLKILKIATPTNSTHHFCKGRTGCIGFGGGRHPHGPMWAIYIIYYKSLSWISAILGSGFPFTFHYLLGNSRSPAEQYWSLFFVGPPTLALQAWLVFYGITLDQKLLGKGGNVPLVRKIGGWIEMKTHWEFCWSQNLKNKNIYIYNYNYNIYYIYIFHPLLLLSIDWC